MFKTRGEAERAEQALASELGLSRSAIQTSPGAGVTDAGYDPARSYEERGFFASLKNLMLPEEDRYAYAEGMRRGAVLLNVKVDDNQLDRASDILEHAGAVDLDAQEAEWRKSGWTGYDASAHGGMRTAAAGAMPAAGQDETIKVVEENLVVGKRAVEGGRVRVRSYVVETPVEANVTLHEERVTLERNPVDRPATAADLAAFQERTIEARATSEEAVVSKEARIVEEIEVRKQAADRVETVRDTVRKTEVEVEDSSAGHVGAATTGGTRTGGTTTGGTSTGTGVAGSVDRALNTNVSGANPGANAPDGTGSNPPGTMASRAVDKTLGTNISGANPERK
jgi:uncharacterized protein (TIGR02271 family)